MARSNASIASGSTDAYSLPGRRLATIAEFMEYARIGRNTCYRLIASNAVTAYKAGRILRVDLDSVDQWLQPINGDRK